MNTKKGFTVLELLVAIGLFSTIVAIATGAFTNALRAQRQVASLIAAQSNASLALEQMTREIRTGYLFCHDPGSAAADPACGCQVNGNIWTCSELKFYNAAAAPVAYSFASGTLMRTEGGGSAQSITSANVSVSSTASGFVLFGNTEGDNWNPRITILLGVGPKSNDPGVMNNILDLETSVSARGIDCTSGSPVAC